MKQNIGISILGSCVTRDALEFAENITVDKYLSRVSIISLVSKKIKSNIEISTNLDGFVKRTLDEDINKLHLREIKKTKSDYFIIDFIDERFALLQNEDCFLTCSNHVESDTNAINFFKNKVPRLTMENLSLWIQSAKLFIKSLKNHYNEEKIILHEAYWAGSDYNSRRNNTYLAIYYNFIKILIPRCKVIKIPESLISANKNHKWGPAPFHYNDIYYQNFIIQLSLIVNCNIIINSKFTLEKTSFQK